MKNSRDLDRLVAETVMGWPFDRARAFSPTSNFGNAWEMEEYLLEDPARAEAFGAALAAEIFPQGLSGLSPAQLALGFAHASGAARCRAALRACGHPEPASPPAESVW